MKLYVLNEKRVWDDRGTGHVTCTLNDKLGGTTLVVRSETDGNSEKICFYLTLIGNSEFSGTGLLESKIQMDTAYQKQQVCSRVFLLFVSLKPFLIDQFVRIQLPFSQSVSGIGSANLVVAGGNVN